MTCWLRQTLIVGESVMGLGNFPCATQRLIVDFASEVVAQTSFILSSSLEFFMVGLNWLVGVPMIPY